MPSKTEKQRRFFAWLVQNWSKAKKGKLGRKAKQVTKGMSREEARHFMKKAQNPSQFDATGALQLATPLLVNLVKQVMPAILPGMALTDASGRRLRFAPGGLFSYDDAIDHWWDFVEQRAAQKELTPAAEAASGTIKRVSENLLKRLGITKEDLEKLDPIRRAVLAGLVRYQMNQLGLDKMFREMERASAPYVRPTFGLPPDVAARQKKLNQSWAEVMKQITRISFNPQMQKYFRGRLPGEIGVILAKELQGGGQSPVFRVLAGPQAFTQTGELTPQAQRFLQQAAARSAYTAETLARALGTDDAAAAWDWFRKTFDGMSPLALPQVVTKFEQLDGVLRQMRIPAQQRGALVVSTVNALKKRGLKAPQIVERLPVLLGAAQAAREDAVRRGVNPSQAMEIVLQRSINALPDTENPREHMLAAWVHALRTNGYSPQQIRMMLRDAYAKSGGQLNPFKYTMMTTGNYGWDSVFRNILQTGAYRSVFNDPTFQIVKNDLARYQMLDQATITLAKKYGVDDKTLQNWKRRYGVLTPQILIRHFNEIAPHFEDYYARLQFQSELGKTLRDLQKQMYGVQQAEYLPYAQNWTQYYQRGNRYAQIAQQRAQAARRVFGPNTYHPGGAKGVARYLFNTANQGIQPTWGGFTKAVLGAHTFNAPQGSVPRDWMEPSRKQKKEKRPSI